jgi:Leucine-rich repeat (LRR) protein
VLESIICDVFDALEIRSIIDSMVTDSLQSIGMSGPIQPPRLSEREIKNVTSKMELNEPTQLQDADNSKGLIITEFDQICVHKNERIRCDICTASVVCEHGALRHECSLCPSQTREASRFKVAARTITKLQRSVFGLTGVKPEIVQKFESFGRKHLKSFQTAAKKLILVSAVGRKSLVEHLQEEIQKGSASGGRAVFAILKAQGVARKIYAKQKAKKAKLLREQMHFLGCVQTVQRRWRELVAYRKSKVEKQAIANRASSQIASFWRGWHFRRYLENYKKVFKKCVSNIQRLFRERMQRKMIRLARESLVLKACLLLQKCFRQKQLDKAVLKKGAILLEMLATEISNYASTNETISDHEQILYLRKIVMYTPKSSRIAVGLIPEPEWSFVQNDLVSTKKNKTVSALAAKFGFGYARRPPARCMGITLKQLMTIFRPKKASGKVMASINRTVSTALGYLDLQNLGLSLVPTMISTCKWIKMLALRNNLLVEIPSIIGIFTLLEDLRIQDNRIATIHPALGKCINLKRILASNNNLRSLPDVFSGMTELRLLSLKSNPLVEMPVSIGALTHCLNDCDFAEFKECTFPPRKILRQGVPVAMPFMQKFYDATQSFSGYSLVASNCSILEFPPCMLSFRSLKSIDMAFNLISVIPAFVWSLLNLNSIILDSNRISIITEELRCLTNLTRLSLSDNPVEVLPASIRCMPQLIDLKTKGCPLTSPPVSIAQSKYAGPRVRKYFDAIERSVDSQSISWTKLGMATFPGDWKSSNMLLNLDVSNNDLTSVPGGVIKLLESLQVFKASRNNISSVCFELFSNPAVKLIDLSENQISKLPEAASQCRSVAVLLLNNNLLTTLPSKSMNLESLTELNLSNNCLTSIQMHWALAPSLRTLKMNGNLLTDVQTWNGAGQDTPPTRTLEFHDNRFKAIPLQVFIFLEVTKLDISMNAIKKLPMTINVLTQLTNLRISSTAISTIPDEFSTL